MAISKIQLDGNTLIDLTGDTTTESRVLQGYTFHKADGSQATGSMQIESSKTATPAVSSQTILPSTGYDALAQVVVAAIPYTETDNSAGGKTVTIAGA